MQLLGFKWAAIYFYLCSFETDLSTRFSPLLNIQSYKHGFAKVDRISLDVTLKATIMSYTNVIFTNICETGYIYVFYQLDVVVNLIQVGFKSLSVIDVYCYHLKMSLKSTQWFMRYTVNRQSWVKSCNFKKMCNVLS